jgi:hypothetical protein
MCGAAGGLRAIAARIFFLTRLLSILGEECCVEGEGSKSTRDQGSFKQWQNGLFQAKWNDASKPSGGHVDV